MMKLLYDNNTADVSAKNVKYKPKASERFGYLFLGRLLNK